MTDASATPTDTIELSLKGAKPKVEIRRALGVLPRVFVDGEQQRPHKGGWMIPVGSAKEEKLSMQGVLPGFQRFEWRGDVVAKLGAHVRTPEKVVMFAPILMLVALPYFMTVVLALALFFMNIPVVKNPNMPRGLRIALPVINTVAATVAVIAVLTLVNAS